MSIITQLSLTTSYVDITNTKKTVTISVDKGSIRIAVAAPATSVDSNETDYLVLMAPEKLEWVLEANEEFYARANGAEAKVSIIKK